MPDISTVIRPLLLQEKQTGGSLNQNLILRNRPGDVCGLQLEKEAVTLPKRCLQEAESEQQTHFTQQGSAKSSSSSSSPCWSEGLTDWHWLTSSVPAAHTRAHCYI